MKRAFMLASITGSVWLCLTVCPRTGRTQATVSINWYDTKQTIEGFGAGQVASYAEVLNNHPKKNAIMDLAFSYETGIGLTFFRTAVMPSLESTPGVWTYTGDPQADAQASLMRDAAGRGAKLIATVASPPAWMKTNGALVGGSLSTSQYHNYATYLSRYAKDYAQANNVSIYALSLSNEPNAVVVWDSCSWTSAQLATFLGGELRTTFAADGIVTKIIAPETSEWNLIDTYMASTYNNSLSLGRVDIIAGHEYGPRPSLPPSDHGKPVWQTEISLSYNPWTLEGALQWAKDIHDGITNARMAVWMYFTLALWENEYSLMALDPYASIPYTVSKGFYMLGNFSKFVRPGFVRMTTGTAPSGVYVSAYRNPTTDQFVIVAINQNSSPVTLNFSMNGFWTHEVTPYVTSDTKNLYAESVTYLQNTQILPAQSVVSYVSRTRNFELWANAPHAQVVAGDFNGDGRADIALVGGDGWSTVPVALSLGYGEFSVRNYGLWDFALWANTPGAQVAAGDVNGDGRDDLIVTGVPGWSTVPVAISNGDGSFHSVNEANDMIPYLSLAQGAKLVMGDVNNDGRDDLILTGGAGWTTIPVGFASATTPGRFVTCPSCTLGSVSQWTTSGGWPFTTWAQDPYARPYVTDFNGDGRADIALMSGAGWSTVPLAIAGDNNTFSIYNVSNSNLAVWSQAPGAKPQTGCRRTLAIPGHSNWHHCSFGGDILGDLALTGGPGWSTIPVGFHAGSGSFSPVTNNAVSEFPAWAQDANAKAVSGDFDGDGRADIALVGGNMWWTIPIAWSQGNGTFTVTNYAVD